MGSRFDHGTLAAVTSDADMRLTIELDREADGRWIAEVPELSILLYGDSKLDATAQAQPVAREIPLDRIDRAELPPDAANAIFDIAA